MKAWQCLVKRPALAAAAIALLVAASRAVAEPRVVIISIDGLRGDVALRADMPNLRKLMARGSFTFWATTTPAAITLPSHASMLTGVTIERHGLEGNDDDEAAKKKLLVPTIFDLARDAGLSTAMVTGKSKFIIFAKSVDYLDCPEALRGFFKRVRAGSTRPTLKSGNLEDNVVGDEVVALFKQATPRLLFVHFGKNDFIGHSKGWGSVGQIENLAVTDAAIGRIFDAMQAANVLDETTIILTADHGGAGRQHGKESDPSKFIPWIIAGPGVQKNLDLSLFRKRPIRTYDTFATACSVLGLTPTVKIDGAPVIQAFESTQLLKTVPASQPTTMPTTRQESKP